jgi:hypothetical protein
MWCVVGRHSAPKPPTSVAAERRDEGWAYEPDDVGTAGHMRYDRYGQLVQPSAD